MQLDSNAVSALAAVVAVVVSVFAMIVESRRSRSAHQVSLVLDFDNRFHSEQMAKKRHVAASFLLASRSLDVADPQWDQVSDVLDFFQTVGTFAKAGHVNTEIVHKFFFYWLSRYWMASEGYVSLTQASSPMTWADAGWLYGRLRAFDQRRNNGSLCEPTSAELDEFFKWENANLAR